MKAGWEVKPLGEVCEKITDGTHHSPKKTSAIRQPGQFPYVTSKNIRNGVLDQENVTYVDADFHAAVYSRCPPDFGDVLLTKDGSNTGQVTLNTFDEPISLLSSVALIKPKIDQVLARYIVYYLQSDDGFENLTGQMTGAAIKRIILRNIKTSLIPIPPLEEQKQIVTVLDAAFEGLTRATENARANLQNARELFEVAKDELLTASDETWSRGKLELLGGPVATGPFGSLLHKSDYVVGKTPIVNPAHIVNGKIAPDLGKTVGPETMARLTSYVMKKGDIVIGRRGDMGRCATVGEVENGWLCGTGSFYIRPTRDVEPELVSHILRSRTYVAKLEGLSTGATMLNISNKTLAGLELALPPTTEQAAMLRKIDRLAEETKFAETQYTTKLNDIAQLRQSLLQKAFAGELT